MSIREPEQQVHVVDDDHDARESLAFLLSTSGIPAKTYASARAFLNVAARVRGVVVTDIRMPDMDGLQMVRRLSEMGVSMPVIVMTGYADVPLAVAAMKAGVFDFIEKPYGDEAMLGAIQSGLLRGQRAEVEQGEIDEIRRRIARLSPRERQILDGLVAGKPNKTMAHDLTLSQRTVEIYRANVMVKMHAQSLSELVRMSISVGVI